MTFTPLLATYLPIEQIGAESLRERGASSALPPLYFLHVWWARRPLIVARAAVLASLLPAYEAVAQADDPVLRQAFPTPEAYHAWFLRLLGIFGDPAETRRRLQEARRKGIRIPGGNPYGYPRAFTANPDPETLALMRRLLRLAWGREDLTVLDPFAGGGSIPFEAIRFGLDALANELNPVAAVVLQATLVYPARFGPALADEIRRWGQVWADRVRERLAPYFPKAEGENIFAYLWARTVACPRTGKPVPLSPNWWLSKGKTPLAVRPLVHEAWDAPRFVILRRTSEGRWVPVVPASVPPPFDPETVGQGFDPDEGTVSRGVGRSLWTGEAIPGDYIKQEAQAGRMGQMLYAVALKKRGGFAFRAPTPEDLEAVARAEAEVRRQRPRWEAEGLIPTEPVPAGNDPRPLHYGMTTWADFFAPRQLLALATFVAELRGLRPELQAALGPEKAAAVETYLGLALDKAVDYNSVQTFWDPKRGIRHAFSRHDFAFRWIFAEFDASANLLPWVVEQVIDAYKGLARLLEPRTAPVEGRGGRLGRARVLQGSALRLDLPDASVDAVITDPPYYENVMYAELSDFFYVWLKRTVGHLYPEWFAAPLTDKDEEAVANPARFAGLPSARKKRELARRDYERKMARAFREVYRVLKPQGVLTVMFTHKQVEAWDTLATALIESGFIIEASWPVHTESEHSLHQAQKNAAQSTILLLCCKRPQPQSEGAWWEDLQGQVRRVAREKAAEFHRLGIRGVDLYISTFGPVLAVISRHWPVYTGEIDEDTGQPRRLRPEVALDLARTEVLRLRKRLLGVEVQFDPVTDWYLHAWDTFRAREFPADEARKLALILGLDLERDLVRQRVLGKKGSRVVLLPPVQRRARGRVDPQAEKFPTLLDALHTAMLVYREDGGPACEAFLKRTGLLRDAAFKALVAALVKAIPRVRDKAGRFLLEEAEDLERLRAAFFAETIPVPKEEATGLRGEQLELL